MSNQGVAPTCPANSLLFTVHACRHKGNLVFLVVQSRLFVTGTRDRSGFTSKCRLRGRSSTLDMVMIFASTRSNFVTGAVDRDFSTCGSLSEIGGSLAKAAFWCLHVVFRSVLATKRRVRAAACES